MGTLAVVAEFASIAGMSTVANSAADAAAGSSLSFLENLTAGYGPRDFAIRAWDGDCLDPHPGQPTRFTIVLQHPGGIRRMFWPPNGYSLPEAYVYNDIDILGDIHAFFRLANHLRELSLGLWQKLKLARALSSDAEKR